MTPAVKICGITRAEDALHAEALGAAAVGFIFYPESPRYIEPADVCGVSNRLGPFVARVGVFVNETVELIAAAAEAARLTAIQCHGDIDPRNVAETTGLRVIMTFRVGQDFRAAHVLDYPGCGILLDAYHPSLPGGTGTTADWSVAQEAARLAPVILAGGIGPDNVLDAIRAVQPDALDVSSGVEVSPGVKDPEKIRRLFATLRDAGV